MVHHPDEQVGGHLWCGVQRGLRHGRQPVQGPVVERVRAGERVGGDLPHGAGGQGGDPNNERERETWLLEDDEVWADGDLPTGVLGRTCDDQSRRGSTGQAPP